MEPRTCPFCGGELKPGLLGGLCPRCTLKQTIANTLVATSLGGFAHLWRAPSWGEIEAAEKGGVTP